MSSGHDRNHDGDPHDAQDEVASHDFEDHPEIRELLGSLDAPRMPPEVRARLNAVIIHEAVQRQTSSPGRNLRRLGVAWIGGAAAVLALATGGGYAIQQLSGGDSSSSSVADTSSSAEKSDESFSAESPSTDAEGGGDMQSEGLSSRVAGLPTVREATFAKDALAAARTLAPTADRVDPPAADRAGCAPLRAQRQGVTVVNVRFESAAAVLLIDEGPPPVASLYDCEGAELLSAPLPEAP